MKNSKEIAETVFERRDEHLKKQALRRSRIKKISYMGSTACLCAVVLLAVNNIGNDNKKIPSFSDKVILETTRDGTSVEKTSENIDSNKASTSDKNISSDAVSNLTDSVNTATENRTEQISPNNDNKNDTDLTFSKTVTERPTHEQSFVSQPNYSPAPKSEVGTTSTDYVPAESKTAVQVTDSVDTTERETTVSTTETEISTEPILDENTLANQFYELSYKNITYTLNSEKINEEYIGNSVDVVDLSGTSLSTTGYVYSIANISEDVAVAVRFEGNSEYYLYFNQSYYPETLGVLLSDLDLKNTVTFGEMYCGYDSSAVCPVGTYQTEQVFVFLDNNSQSPNLNDSSFHKKRVSLSTNLDLLNITNKSMAFTEDGYLITNILEQQYTFYVGEDEISNLMSLLEISQSDSTE